MDTDQPHFEQREANDDRGGRRRHLCALLDADSERREGQAE
jgi:hypothetical protein